MRFKLEQLNPVTLQAETGKTVNLKLEQVGLRGPAGADGVVGPQGPAGADGSPDTAAQVLAKLVTVDGSGSGLDADTVHGVSGTDLAKLDQENTFSGTQTLRTGPSVEVGIRLDQDITAAELVFRSGGEVELVSPNGTTRIIADGMNANRLELSTANFITSYLEHGVDGHLTLRNESGEMRLSTESGKFEFRGFGDTLFFEVDENDTAPRFKGDEVYHAGNIGNATGLNASTLEGQSASDFKPATRTGFAYSTATTAIDWSQYDNMVVQVETNTTLSFSGATNRQLCMLILNMNHAAPWTVTFPANVRFGSTITEYTATTDPNKSDYLLFSYDAADAKYDLIAVSKGH